MRLDEIVISRAHRTLKGMEHYRSAGTDEIAPYFTDDMLRESEKIVGIYENIPGEQEECIVITTLGLHIFLQGNWHVVDYEQITDIKAPQEGADFKISADNLLLILPNQELDIPVRGGKGKFRDVWRFLTFLQRITSAFHTHTKSEEQSED